MNLRNVTRGALISSQMVVTHLPAMTYRSFRLISGFAPQFMPKKEIWPRANWPDALLRWAFRDLQLTAIERDTDFAGIADCQ
jgi:hypothetical protein